MYMPCADSSSLEETEENDRHTRVLPTALGSTNHPPPPTHQSIWGHEAMQHKDEAVGGYGVMILQAKPSGLRQLPGRPSALDSGRAHPQVSSEQTGTGSGRKNTL